jgi:hypothetical protein
MWLLWLRIFDKLNVAEIINKTCAVNHLKPSGNFTYRQVYQSTILRGAHIAFVCFVRISEQTATFAL